MARHYSTQSLNALEELRQLRDENVRLKALLTHHGISWEKAPVAGPTAARPKPVPDPVQFCIADKIALFRRLFRGRDDIYPQRWESAKGTSGYAPACGNEWKPGICHKPSGPST